MKKSNLYQREPKEEKVLRQKTQIEKFNARYAKDKKDQEDVIESQMKKEVATSSQGHDNESAEELMREGSIREAAVVFSHAGLGAFAKMFGNSVESAVEKVLKEKLDSILESTTNKFSSLLYTKMIEMLEGMTEGMNSFVNSEVTVLDPDISEILVESEWEPEEITDKELFEHKSEEVLPTEPKESLLQEVPASVRESLLKADKAKFEDFKDAVKQMVPILAEESVISAEPIITAKQEPKDDDGSDYIFDRTAMDLRFLPFGTERFGTSKADTAVVEPYIIALLRLNAGKIVKSNFIIDILRSEYNITMANFTIIMQKLMKKDFSIEKVGHGFYKYEEKTFRPTV